MDGARSQRGRQPSPAPGRFNSGPALQRRVAFVLPNDLANGEKGPRERRDKFSHYGRNGLRKRRMNETGLNRRWFDSSAALQAQLPRTSTDELSSRWEK